MKSSLKLSIILVIGISISAISILPGQFLILIQTECDIRHKHNIQEILIGVSTKLNPVEIPTGICPSRNSYCRFY